MEGKISYVGSGDGNENNKGTDEIGRSTEWKRKGEEKAYSVTKRGVNQKYERRQCKLASFKQGSEKTKEQSRKEKGPTT